MSSQSSDYLKLSLNSDDETMKLSVSTPPKRSILIVDDEPANWLLDVRCGFLFESCSKISTFFREDKSWTAI
ncbi:hypothetical protein, partial [Oceanospirillum sediminis]|uniref:hypothetical protein n=1 Tax=Oceanospirillum sediminis TaxID=2760088 RepID=UPI001C7184BA